MPDVSRRTLVILLLRSYLDALTTRRMGEPMGYVRSGSVGNPTAAEAAGFERKGSLWRQGSYSDLELALQKLGANDASAYFATWLTYVAQPSRRKARHVRYVERLRAEKSVDADRGLSLIEDMMPRRIDVPNDILSNFFDYGDSTPSKATRK